MEAIKEISAEGLKDMGKVMRLVMSRAKGTADGKIVGQRVKDLIRKRMRLGEIYERAITAGIENDPRGRDVVLKELETRKKAP